MALLYMFSVDNPKLTNGVEDFPPSVTSSEWFDNIKKYSSKFALDKNFSSPVSFIFADETDLNKFLKTYVITDETLKSDITAWKNAHGITYHHMVYSLPESVVTSSSLC